MFNLNDILSSAQTSQNMAQMAERFGLTAGQTQAAVQSLMPAFVTGLQQQAMNPQAVSELFAAMAPQAAAKPEPEPQPKPQPKPKESEAPPASAFPDPFQYGSALMAQIFGSSSQAAGQVAQQAAQASGLQPQLVQQMMPWVAGMFMQGLTQAMQGQGLGPFAAPPAPKPGTSEAVAQSGFEAMTKIMQGSVQMQQVQLEGLQMILSHLMPKK